MIASCRPFKYLPLVLLLLTNALWLPTSLPVLADTDEITIRLDPFIPTNLGDRVVEPTTIHVTAPGASCVWAYVRPVEWPYGGKVLGKSRLIGKDCKPSDGFSIEWPALEKSQCVQIYARAYYKRTHSYRTSRPMVILLDWARAPIKPPAAMPHGSQEKM